VQLVQLIAGQQTGLNNFEVVHTELLKEVTLPNVILATFACLRAQFKTDTAQNSIKTNQQ